MEARQRDLEYGPVAPHARPPLGPSRRAGLPLAERPWLATGFILLIATSFATGTTIVRFAYEAGANTLGIVTVRTTTAALALGLVLLLRRVPVRLSPREGWAAPLLGLLLAGYSLAMYRGLEYMPVALTVLTFYTYPLLAGILAWAIGQERPSLAAALALPLAFLGLVLALGVTGAGFDPRGAAWAGLGAVGFAALLVLTARLFAGGDTLARSVVMLATASASCILALLIGGTAAFPATAFGWGALMASATLYAVAIGSIILAAARLGSGRVAMGMNVEPVASLILTHFILGERLREAQLAGAALVIAAIFLFRLGGAGRGAPGTPPGR